MDRHQILTELAEQTSDPATLRTLAEAGHRPTTLRCDPGIDVDDTTYPVSFHVAVASVTTDPGKLTRYAATPATCRAAASNPACPADARLVALDHSLRLGGTTDPNGARHPDTPVEAVVLAAETAPAGLAELLARHPRSRTTETWIDLLYHSCLRRDVAALTATLSHLPAPQFRDIRQMLTGAYIDEALLDADTSYPLVQAGFTDPGIVLAAVGLPDSFDVARFALLRDNGTLTDETLTADRARDELRPITSATLAVITGRRDPVELAWAIHHTSGTVIDVDVGDDEHPTVAQILDAAAAIPAAQRDPVTICTALYFARSRTYPDAATLDAALAAHTELLATILPHADVTTLSQFAANSPTHAAAFLAHVTTTDDRIYAVKHLALLDEDAEHPAVAWAVEQVTHDPAVARDVVGYIDGYPTSGHTGAIIRAARVAAIGVAFQHRPRTARNGDEPPKAGVDTAQLVADAFTGKLTTLAELTPAATLLADGWTGSLDDLVDAAQQLARK